MNILLLALAVFLAVQWFAWRANFIAILLWITAKGLEPPSEEEFRECVRAAVRRQMGCK